MRGESWVRYKRAGFAEVIVSKAPQLPKIYQDFDTHEIDVILPLLREIRPRGCISVQEETDAIKNIQDSKVK